jgi:Lon protease-like protein
VEETQPLPDGRSNILVRGGERFALVRLVDAAHPYHVAEVEGYTDEPEADGPLAEVAGRVRETFARLDRAARAIADDRATGAVLPDDPGALSFAIASMIDLDAAQRQRMLVSRSPSGRLQELAQLLARAVGPLERRAVVHQRAKSNGHGPSSHA